MIIHKPYFQYTLSRDRPAVLDTTTTISYKSCANLYPAICTSLQAIIPTLMVLKTSAYYLLKTLPNIVLPTKTTPVLPLLVAQ